MDYNEVFNSLNEYISSDVAIIIGIIVIAVLLVVSVVLITLYVFQALALSKLAKKNNMENPWLAWIPCGNMYLLGKLGFEIYAPDEQKNETYKWILLGCSIGTILLTEMGLSPIASLGAKVFSVWAYYYIFNKINKSNGVLLTILTAVFDIGGILLFFNKKNFTNENNCVNKEFDITPTTVENEQKEKTVKVKYCSSCGNKLERTNLFCTSCGKKIEK